MNEANILEEKSQHQTKPTQPREHEIVIEKEYECAICSELLYRPVTISCGHSFCKTCLESALHLKPICPICRAPCFGQSFNENITLKAIIQSKYPQQLAKREDDAKMRGNPVKQQPTLPLFQSSQGEPASLQGSSPTHSQPPKKFENVLGLRQSSKPHRDYHLIFPGCKGVVRVQFSHSVDLFNHVCADKRLIIIPPDLHGVTSPTAGYLMKVNQVVRLTNGSNPSGQLELHGTCVERVMIESINEFQCGDSPEFEAQFGLQGQPKLTLLAVGGHVIQDNLNFIGNEQVISDLTHSITHIVLEVLERIGQNTGLTAGRIMEQFFVDNSFVLDVATLTTAKKLSDYSLVMAGAIRFVKQGEKQRLFETTNIVERLLLIRDRLEQLNHLGGLIDPTQVFDLDTPAKSLHGLIGSILLIVAILFILYFGRRLVR